MIDFLIGATLGGLIFGIGIGKAIELFPDKRIKEAIKEHFPDVYYWKLVRGEGSHHYLYIEDQVYKVVFSYQSPTRVVFARLLENDLEIVEMEIRREMARYRRRSY